ncbi:acetyltransferase [Endozoicomonas sp. ISHI1]|uniref:acetyltransferase n=1 Tax=Endozoicomonas sp. ISHI1 TaxID=2825882 RepID=UPI00214743EF|nr:acetyltransferase [Endozoicomonas sp. ISHI1]
MELLILGAGGHAKVVADAALASGQWSGVAFLDDRFPELKFIGKWSVIGRVTDLKDFIDKFPFMALGVGVNYDNHRLTWLEQGLKAGAQFPPVIHPSAVISPFSKIGAGTVVFAGAIVNVDSEIGNACILNTGCTVDHDCMIGDGSHISPGASLAGCVSIGKRVWVGMRASVIQGLSVYSDVVIGAGAVVINDVPVGAKMIGVPAKRVI